MTDNIEIIQISEFEFKMGENKLSLIEGNIIDIVAQGEQTTEIALNHEKICELLSSGLEGKINYLIDLNKCGKNSTEARKLWKEMSERENTNKVATFGLNPVARVIASFVIGKLQKGDLRFFLTKGEAMSWIVS
jgi:hypothetical protein